MNFLFYIFLPFQLISGNAQGTTYTIKYVSKNSVVRKSELDSLFHVIDRSLSLYHASSRINEFNAKGRVLMDEHMKNVIHTSLQCYHKSGGAFDITSATISTLWGFGVHGKNNVPNEKQITQALRVTGSNLLIIKGDSLLASRPGVKIDCNGIAQGYTVDVISAFLVSKGLDQFMVELGGEIYVKGDHPETKWWKIGIESAEAIAGNWYPIEQYLEIKDRAVTTSGIHRKQFSFKGKKYSHIIDPKKGRPVDTDIISVTVVAAKAITADAWDNTLMVMGMSKLRHYLSNNPDIQVHVVYLDKEGSIQTYSNIKK